MPESRFERLKVRWMDKHQRLLVIIPAYLKGETVLLTRIAAVVFFVYVIRLVSKGKLSLRYFFFWLSLSVVILIAAISPGFIGAIGELFGFVPTTHFVFFLGLFLLLAFSLMLSVVVTKQTASI